MERIIKGEFLGRYKTKWYILECNICHKEFKRPKHILDKCPCLFCSHKCSLQHTSSRYDNFSGSKNGRWRGGRSINCNGYVLIHSLDHPYRNYKNQVFEHHLIMEKFLGRYLKPEEVVHHLNGIKDDNRPENLVLMNKKEHRSFHQKISYKLLGRDPLTGRFIHI